MAVSHTFVTKGAEEGACVCIDFFRKAGHRLGVGLG